MNKYRKTEFNFNYICATAYRVLLLLKFLMVKGLTREEIIKNLGNDDFVPQKINSEIIRTTINSLKDVGCDISRPTKANGYEYRLIKNPFSLKLNEADIKLLNKFRRKTAIKNDFNEILNINSLLEKFCLVIDDKDTIESLKSKGLLAGANTDLIKQINICCKNKSRVVFKYLSHKKITDFEMITSFMKYEKDKLYVWGYSTKYKEFSYIRVDKIKSYEIKEKFAQNDYEKSVIRYEMFDQNYELEPNEILVKRTDNSLIIDYISVSNFHSIQKFLEKGCDYKILEPDDFKKEFISVLKSIKEVYSNV